MWRRRGFTKVNANGRGRAVTEEAEAAVPSQVRASKSSQGGEHVLILILI